MSWPVSRCTRPWRPVALFGPRLARDRALVAGPVRGVLLLTVVSCGVAFLFMMIWTLSITDKLATGESGASVWRVEMGLLMLALPNLAGGALLFGLGVPVTGS